MYFCLSLGLTNFHWLVKVSLFFFQIICLLGNFLLLLLVYYDKLARLNKDLLQHNLLFVECFLPLSLRSLFFKLIADFEESWSYAQTYALC